MSIVPTLFLPIPTQMGLSNRKPAIEVWKEPIPLAPDWTGWAPRKLFLPPRSPPESGETWLRAARLRRQVRTRSRRRG